MQGRHIIIFLLLLQGCGKDTVEVDVWVLHYQTPD